MAIDFDGLTAFARTADGRAVRRFVSEDLQPVSPAEMLDVFTWATIAFLVEGDLAGLNGYDVARKLRGGLWPILMQTASEAAKGGGPCTQSPASLLDILWNDAGRLPRGREIPKPWVLRASDPVPSQGGKHQSLVQLVLFGLAASRCEVVADTLAATIENGLRDGHRREVWRILDEEIVIDEGLDCLRPDRSVDVRLLSPLKLSANGSASFNYGTLLETLIDRVEGLGLWHGVKLSCDFRDMRARARAITVNTKQSEIGSWIRHSGRANRLIPMLDTRGTLALAGDFSGLEPFLSLLPITHVGKDTRHGHGWCQIVDTNVRNVGK